MNKLILGIGMVLSFGASATDSTYTSSTGMVDIPRVVVDGGAAFTGVQLLLSPDGTYSILSATAEVINEVVATDPDNNTYALRTSIVNFNGLDSGTIFELEVGQLWRIDSGAHFDFSISSLSVIILRKKSGGFGMSIDGSYSPTLVVHPFEFISKIDSTIPNFGGIGGGDIFELANGDLWTVSSGFISVSDVDTNPNVTIYELDNEYIMMVRGSHNDVTVEPFQ